MRLAIAIACLAANMAYADVYRVGDINRDACDYATIQDAIDAATANGPGAETILIANTASYTNVALVVGNKSLTIEGGFDTCLNAQPDVPADLSGDGNDPVISIVPPSSASTQVTLSGLTLHGGGHFDASGLGSQGGGVYAANNVSLTIENTTIENNRAREGAGLYLQGNLGTLTLRLSSGVRILSNQAYGDGGGIYVASRAHVKMAADTVTIDSNISGHDGGGIFATGGDVVIGNPMQFAARQDVSGAVISNNLASVSGGGVALTSAAGLYAEELILDGNLAGQSGAGIYADTGSYVNMQRDYPSGPALQCPNYRECSRLSNNSVGSVAGTQGGGIALYSGASANLAQTIVRGNTAQDGSAIYIDDDTSLTMESVLVTENQSYDTTAGGVTIHANFSSTGPFVSVAYSSFGDNRELASNGMEHGAEDIVVTGGTQLLVYSSAFYDSAYPIVAYASYVDDCTAVMMQALDDPFGSHTRRLHTDTPGFNNAAAGDYSLLTTSALTDHCDSSAYQAQYRDLVLTPRCSDDPDKPDTYGTCDIGAYESDDHIFAGDFE